MTDTIGIAREAGLIKTVDCCGVPDKFCGQDEWKGNLKVFEALVRADEREEANRRANASWTLMCEKMVAAEREACAKVCDTTPPYPFRPSIEAAHAIRARGNT
jgi:hypothetical protein